MARTPLDKSDAPRDSESPRAGAELERSRLASRGRELDRLMLEAIQRRTELDERERRLGELQSALDQQRAEIGADRARIESQTIALREEHQLALQEIARRMEAIRKHERELERRTALARDEAQRDRVEADAARLAAEEQTKKLNEEQVCLAAERRELSARQEALRTRESAVERQASEFEGFANSVRATAESFDRRQAELDRRAAELAAAAERVERRTAALRQEHELALQEVARRVEAVRGQERELERRAALARDELSRQRAEVEALRQEAERHETRTRAGYEELAAQLAKLGARAAELDAREAAEAMRAEEFARREREVNATLMGLDQRRTELAEREAELIRADERLSRREGELASQGRELEGRLLKARDGVVKARREIEELKRAAAEHRDAAAGEHARARAERERVDRDAAALESSRVEVARTQERLRQIEAETQRQRDEIAGERDRLAAEQMALKASRQALESKRGELDKRERKLSGAAAKVEWETEELVRRRVVVDRERSEITDLRREIEGQAEAIARREVELLEADRDRRRAAENIERELSAERLRLEDRRAELDESERRLAELTRAVEARRAELDAARDQIEIRDAESRQRALALEVRTDELDRRQAVVDFAEEEMFARRAAREAEFERLEQEIRARQRAVEAAESSILTAPRRWPLRAAGIAAVAAVATAVLWLNGERPLYRSRVGFVLQTDTPNVERSLRAHVAALLSPESLSAWLTDETARREWSRASAEGTASAVFALNPPTIEVRLDASNAIRARSLVETIAGQYVEAVNAVTPAALLPSVYADVQQRRDAAAAELIRTQERLRESNTMLSLCPPASRRDELEVRVREMRREYDETVRALEQGRAALALLRRGEAAVGIVTDEQVQQALREDPIYSADVEERLSEATSFRSELLIAMAPVSERAAELERELERARTSISEHRERNPPVSASTLLEKLASELDVFALRAAEFARAWGDLRARARASPVERDLGVLFEVAAASNAECEGFVAFSRGILERANPESASAEGSGGTRDMVLQTAAQAELARIGAAVDEFSRAAAGVDRRRNVRLSGHDARLGGVESRMSRRHAMVRDRLTAAADRAAAEAREAATSKTAEQVAALESRRDGIGLRLSDAMDALRGLDDDILERRKLEADIARDSEEVERIERQIMALDAQLDRARRGGPQPDRARIVSGADEMVAGAHRIRNAAAAAAAAFGGMWLLCALMLLKNPWRRRSRPINQAAVQAVT